MSRHQTQRERFATEHGFKAYEVVELASKAAACEQAGERECNGDPHGENPNRDDKSRNSELHGRDLDNLTAIISTIVRPKGFTVEFPGLRPVLRNSDGRLVEIPQ